MILYLLYMTCLSCYYIILFVNQFIFLQITCLSVLEDLSELAIGLGNGAVFLFSGDLLRDRTPRHTLLKQEGPCITGIPIY